MESHESVEKRVREAYRALSREQTRNLKQDIKRIEQAHEELDKKVDNFISAINAKVLTVLGGFIAILIKFIIETFQGKSP